MIEISGLGLGLRPLFFGIEESLELYYEWLYSIYYLGLLIFGGSSSTIGFRLALLSLTDSAIDEG